jgi:hypothetical protein
VSYSRHAYNASGNPYYTGITVPWPGYPGNAVPRDPLTSADLDAYFNNSLNGATWFALPPDVRDQAVVEAQRWLMTLCWLPAADCWQPQNWHWHWRKNQRQSLVVQRMADG